MLQQQWIHLCPFHSPLSRQACVFIPEEHAQYRAAVVKWEKAFVRTLHAHLQVRCWACTTY